MNMLITPLILVSFATAVVGQSTTTASLPIFLPDVPNEVVAYMNNGNQTCIIYNAGVRFTFNYTTTSGQSAIGEIDLPTTSNVTGSCGSQQSIIFTFFNGWVLTYNFLSDASTWYVNQITLSYSLQNGTQPFPDAKGTTGTASTYNNMTLYQTSTQSSYQCVAAQSINATSDTGNSFVGMTTYNLQIQAYRTANSTQFANPVGCPADQVSNIVPIAVGAALGALIIIVLIAYFIGRSRNKRGYESV